MLTVIFDGHCGFCMRSIEWALARVPAGSIEAVPAQAPGVLARFGLSREQAAREVWAVDDTGRRFAGAAAVNRVLAEVGGPWRVLSRLYQAPGLRWVEDRTYHWVSTNRQHFAFLGVTPACERDGVACESDDRA